jgi:hypothetical protein
VRLSDAIHAGAKLRPQAFGFYQEAGGSCALGAAYEAVSVADGRPWTSTLPFDHPWVALLVALMEVPCPACGYLHYENQITHLNDKHRWTRERIADWVATQETP